MANAKDKSVWYNMPGVVAAYQSIGAPSVELARYNQAQGGRNRYKITDGTAPTWSRANGWSFTAASTQYLKTGLVFGGPRIGVVVRYSNTPTTGSAMIMVAARTDVYSSGRTTAIGFNVDSGSQWFSLGSYSSTGANTAAGVLGLTAGISNDFSLFYHPWKNGALLAQGSVTWTGSNTVEFYIGAMNDDNAAVFPMTGNILAVAFVEHPIPGPQMSAMQRQMAYCEVNPAWNAWAAQRRYYYLPTETTEAGGIFAPLAMYHYRRRRT